jgi:ribose-phosphate pyrophosphokinase
VNIECAQLFAAHFGKALADQDIQVISPDIGGVKRAERFRDALSTWQPIAAGIRNIVAV